MTPLSLVKRERLAEAAFLAANEVAAIILEIYKTNFEVLSKPDLSPNTIADLRGEEIISQALLELNPSLPIIAEESYGRGKRPVIENQTFWLVDPLDGTKEFVNRRDEFTVNIALIEDRHPILGVIIQPAAAISYMAFSPSEAYRREANGNWIKINSRHPPSSGSIALASRSHLDKQTADFLSQQNIKNTIYVGSSIKFCHLAEGAADLYPRFGPTMEWDTAAGDAILRAAGGSVCDVKGLPLTYGKKEFRNPNFIARGQSLSVKA